MKPIAYLMVERNNQTTYFQTTVPTREEKISHHAIPLYTDPIELTDEVITGIRVTTEGNAIKFARAILEQAQYQVDTHENQEEWLRNVRKTGY
jgi:hypothetical protein